MNRLIFALFILFGACYSQSIIEPYYSPGGQIVEHFAYMLLYDESHEQARWVAYKLTEAHTSGPYKRTNDFRSDPAVKTGSASPADYKYSGYDRGHLAPAGDMRWSTVAMSESFLMSNISPQRPGFNRGIWKRLEEKVREWARMNDEVFVVTGPVLKATNPKIGQNGVSVPSCFYKVILDYKESELKGIAFIMPNEKSSNALYAYAVTIDSVEAVTGIDFFPAIPDSIEEKLEGSTELSKWGL